MLFPFRKNILKIKFRRFSICGVIALRSMKKISVDKIIRMNMLCLETFHMLLILWLVFRLWVKIGGLWMPFKVLHLVCLLSV